MKPVPSSIIRAAAFLALAIFFFTSSAGAALVLHYGFEEGSGTTTQDLAPTEAGDNEGTLTNGATFNSTTPPAAPSSFSLSVDGSNDFVSVGSPGSLLQAAPGFTLAAFVNLDTLASGSFENIIFVSNTTSVSQARAALQVGGTGQFALAGRRADGDTFSRYVSATNTLSTGTWTHLAATVDFSSGSADVRLYLNGALVGNTVATGGFSSGTAISDTASLVANIGARDGGAELADGLIDDVRIYNTALTGPQIAALIPEPSSALLLGLGALTLTCRRRRIP